MEQGPLDRLSDFAFGHDWFVSYCWADGRAYAVALQDALQRQGFSVFLDSSDYAKGDDWRAAGRRALRKTSRLVLVATPRALESEPVAREIEIFAGLGRRIVPIDVEGTLTNAPPDRLPHLHRDILRIQESGAALTTGPSPHVLDALRDSFDLVRQQDRRARWMLLIILALSGLLLIAAVAAWVATVQQGRAEAAQADAVAKARAAQVAEASARQHLADSQLTLARTALDARDGRAALWQLALAWSQVPEGDPRRRAAETLLGAHARSAGRAVAHDRPAGWVALVGQGRLARYWTGEETALVRSADGAPVRDVPHGHEAVFSPDGARLARAEGGRLDVRALDGGADGSWPLPAALGDDVWLAFLGAEALIAVSHGGQAVVLDPRTGAAGPSFAVPAWAGPVVSSPDGRTVLLVGASELWSVDPPGFMAEVPSGGDHVSVSDGARVIVSTLFESPAAVALRDADYRDPWSPERATQARFADGFALSPSGVRVAISNGRLEIYDPATTEIAAPHLLVTGLEGFALPDDTHLVGVRGDVFVHVDLLHAGPTPFEEIDPIDRADLSIATHHPYRRSFGQRSTAPVTLTRSSRGLSLVPEGPGLVTPDAAGLSPDGQDAVTLSGGRMQRWSAAGDAPLWSRERAGAAVAWLVSPPRIALADGATLYLLDADGVEARSLPLPGSADTLLADPTGRLLLVGLGRRGLVGIDTVEARVLWGPSGGEAGPVAFDDSGRTLWLATFDYIGHVSGETTVRGVEPWTGAPLGAALTLSDHVLGFRFEGGRGAATTVFDPFQGEDGARGVTWAVPQPARSPTLLEDVGLWTATWRDADGHSRPMTRAEQQEALAARGGVWPF